MNRTSKGVLFLFKRVIFTVRSYNAICTINNLPSFGMLLPNRHGSSTAYRYGFQGQEKDDEIKGEGNSINYTFRMHDPRVGRFFAVDPLSDDYSFYSPYQFSSNSPILDIELEGLESRTLINETEKEKLKEKHGSVKYWLAERAMDVLDGLFNFNEISNGRAPQKYPILDYNFSEKVLEGEKALIDISVEYGIAKSLPTGGNSGKNNSLNKKKFEITKPSIGVISETKAIISSTKVSKNKLIKNEIKSSFSTRVSKLPPALQRRPKWRKSTLDHLEINSPKDINGNYIDVKTGKPITGKKHIGHQNESWREYQDNPANWKKTRKEVIDDYNDVDNLGYESASSNSSRGAKTKGKENKGG